MTDRDTDFHVPVLLKEVIGSLHIKAGGSYIDATIGGGGHTEAILDRGSKVLGLDVDQNALNFCQQRFGDKANLILVKANFRHLFDVARERGFSQVDGILMDLGVSSHQLDVADYGLSFNKEAPLDMRLDKDLGVQAADLVNNLPESQLAELLTVYGEESKAKSVAKEIIESRPIKSTTELARLVEKRVPRRGKIHPATKTFQALRIVVNSELKNLEEGIDNGYKLLKKGGRLAVISFHSLEDRVVKNKFKSNDWKLVTAEVITPTDAEVNINPRSRSAKLRVAEKIN